MSHPLTPALSSETATDPAAGHTGRWQPGPPDTFRMEHTDGHTYQLEASMGSNGLQWVLSRDGQQLDILVSVAQFRHSRYIDNDGTYYLIAPVWITETSEYLDADVLVAVAEVTDPDKTFRVGTVTHRRLHSFGRQMARLVDMSNSLRRMDQDPSLSVYLKERREQLEEGVALTRAVLSEDFGLSEAQLDMAIRLSRQLPNARDLLEAVTTVAE